MLWVGEMSDVADAVASEVADTVRIAFDLDETLVPAIGGIEAVPFRVARLVFREKLRVGSVAMLRELASDRHDLWIYTTSLRSTWYVKTWFRLLGIRLGGVVNHVEHVKMVKAGDLSLQSLSKFPPAFGIDLLVDDLPGIAVEGERHGFRVLVIRPGDDRWVEKVRRAIGALPAGSGQ